jgi:hypothetical protein
LTKNYLDPSFNQNRAISFAFKNKHLHFMELLFEDKKVKESLKKDKKEIYEFLKLKNNTVNF